MSKVREKVVAEQLKEHLESNKLLHPQQFGFRQKYSTETANCYLLEKIKGSLDKGHVVGAVFLDLKKAFDSGSQYFSEYHYGLNLIWKEDNNVLR